MFEDIAIFNDLPEDMREILVRILLLILTLLLIWILRRTVTWIILKPVKKLIGRTGNTYDDRLIDMIVEPTRWFIIALAILLSAQILEIGGGLLTFVQNVGRSLVIVAILMFIYRLIDLLMPSAPMLARITGLHVDERLLPFFRTAVKIIVIALGLVITLQEWGYDVSGLVAGLGLGGLAFSLAAQDTIANLFGFMALVSDRPFDVGEFIVTSDGTGIVEHVGIRSTRIRQLDQAAIYIPNNKLANTAILNWSRLEKRRIDYVLGVTYDTTSDELRVLLHRIRELLRSQETIDPESVVVYFTNFGGSSLDILVRSYVILADWTEFTAEKERLNLLIMDIVAELGLSIAFPSMSLYVENIEDFPGAKSIARPAPSFTPHEQALLAGDPAALKKENPPTPPPDPEVNVTGQQDEADDD